MKSIFRNSFFAVVCTLVFASSVFGGAVPKRTNVLFVIVDDLRPLIGCYGDPAAITPNLDALAADGMVFERAYAQYPICGPSRASFMTGLRPDTSGHMTNHSSVEDTMPDVMTISRYFKKNGYTSIGMGKVFHYGRGPEAGWSTPFSDSDWLDYVEPENAAKAAKFFKPDSEGLPPSIEAADVPDNGYCDGKMADVAVRNIQALAQSGEPFFMAVGFRHPHLPWCAPKKYWDLYDRSSLPVAENTDFPKEAPAIALKTFGELFGYSDIPDKTPLTDELILQSMHGYYACVSYVDAQLGRVVGALKEHGLYEDTAIVLCGDNGYQHGNNGVWTKGVCWESTTRVPLFVRIPGMPAAGEKSDALVELIDIFPTLCDVARLPVPKQCEGKSLLPYAKNPSYRSDAFACSQLKKGNVIGRSLRTDQYRFTIWEKQGGEVVGIELYDQKKDPQGNVNMAASPENRRIVQKLTKLHRDVWPEPGDFKQ